MNELIKIEKPLMSVFIGNFRFLIVLLSRVTTHELCISFDLNLKMAHAHNCVSLKKQRCWVADGPSLGKVDPTAGHRPMMAAKQGKTRQRKYKVDSTAGHRPMMAAKRGKTR